MDQKRLIGVVALFAGAFGIRLLYIFWLAPAQHLDAGEMELAAANLASQGFLGNVFSPTSGPSAHVAPLYTWFLAAIYSLFGYGTAEARIVQKLAITTVTAVTIAMLPGLARKLRLAPSAGWTAGILAAIFPFYWFDETSGSWEQPLAAFAVVGLLWCLVHLHDQRWADRRWIIAAGLLVGLAGLLQPNLLLIGVGLVAAEWMLQRGNRKRVFLGGISLGLVACLVIAPWTIRNYRVFGTFVPIRSNFGLELRVGNHAEANGKSSTTSWFDPNSPFQRIHPFANPDERAKLERIGEIAYMQEAGDVARNWIREHPDRFASLTTRRVVLYWFPPTMMWEPGTSMIPLRRLVFLAISLGLMAGLVRLWYANPSTAALITAVVLCGSAIYYITHVDVRYRYPIHCVTLLVGCDCIAAMVRFFHRSESKKHAETSSSNGNPDGGIRRSAL